MFFCLESLTRTCIYLVLFSTHTYTQACTYEARTHADTHAHIHPHTLTQRLVVCKPYCRATCYNEANGKPGDALLGIPEWQPDLWSTSIPPPLPGAPCQWSCSLSHTIHMWSLLALTCRQLTKTTRITDTVDCFNGAWSNNILLAFPVLKQLYECALKQSMMSLIKQPDVLLIKL